MAEWTDEVFAGDDWYGRELAGDVFLRCTFSDVDLVEATSAGARFEACRFGNTRLNASRHQDTAFVQCVFERCSLFDAEFDDCKLTGSATKDRRGEIDSFTGVNDPYEQPEDADLVLDKIGRAHV